MGFLIFYLCLFFVFSLYILCFLLFLLLCCFFPIFVQVYRLLPSGGNPLAVNNYHIISLIIYNITSHHISYHTISYHISHHISHHIIYHTIPYHSIYCNISKRIVPFLTHCGRVTQICVFNTLEFRYICKFSLVHSARGNVSRGITPSSTTRVFGEYFLKISVHKSS